MDCRVRWNSLFRMCERFIQSYPYIKKIYSDLHKNLEITATEVDSLKTICDGLKAVEKCVRIFSAEKCTFIEANLTIYYLIDFLWCKNNHFAQNLSLCIKNYHNKRVNQKLVRSLMYAQNMMPVTFLLMK